MNEAGERIYLVYVTAADRKQAEHIGRTCVEERLAACCNIFSNIHSFFWWEGKVDCGEETVLLLKTSHNRLERLRQRIVSLHSYECPCIVAVPVVAGHDPFLDWIRSTTR